MGMGEKLRKIRRRLARLNEAKRYSSVGNFPPKELGRKLGQQISQCRDLTQCLGYI